MLRCIRPSPLINLEKNEFLKSQTLTSNNVATMSQSKYTTKMYFLGKPIVPIFYSL